MLEIIFGKIKNFKKNYKRKKLFEDLINSHKETNINLKILMICIELAIEENNQNLKKMKFIKI